MNSIKHFKLFRFHLIKTNPAPAKAQLGIFNFATLEMKQISSWHRLNEIFLNDQK